MQKYQEFVYVGSQPVRGASVYVYLYGTTTLASLFSDNGVTPTTNPVATDSDGYFSFYAADGRYTVSVVKTGYAGRTLTDVLLEDPVDGSAGVFSTITATGNISSTGGSVTTSGNFNSTNVNGVTHFIPGGSFYWNINGSPVAQMFWNGSNLTTLSAMAPAADSNLAVYSKGGGQIYLGSTTGGGQVQIIPTVGANRLITMTGSVSVNPTIGVTAGSLGISTSIVASGTMTVASGIAVPAGGSSSMAVYFSTSNVGIYVGSGAPTLPAAQGSLYLRTDGGAGTRMYVNNNGSTGWTAY